MDMTSIFARVVSGFVVKAAAAALAIYVAVTVYHYVVGVFSAVNHALPL